MKNDDRIELEEREQQAFAIASHRIASLVRVVDCDAAVVLSPPTMPAERLADRLVADIAGSLVMLRESCYGGVQLTDDQVWERARNIAAKVLVTYHVEDLKDVTS